MTEHSKRAHALLSASGATRWLACPPSARLEDKFPDTTSEHAARGTLAHEIAENTLRAVFGIISQAESDGRRKKLLTHELYSPDMLPAIQSYDQLITRKGREAQAADPNALILIEQRVDFSAYVPEGFGTADAIIITDGILHIFDYKNGRGVAVTAENNPQMRLYALGALEEFDFSYDIHTVRMTISQPNKTGETTEELSAEELRKWGEEKVKPRAALAFKGEGDFCPGDHCGFCRAKGSCRARSALYMKVVRAYNLEEDPDLLTLAEVADLLPWAKPIAKWAKELEAFAHDRAVEGYKVPGHKLVEGSRERTISDEKGLVKEFKAAGIKDSQLYKKSLVGLGALETLAGGKVAFEDLAKDYITVSRKGPALVPEDDKRTEYRSAANDFVPIDDEIEI